MKIITLITLQELSDILEASTITNTINHGTMLIHTINHPAFGKCQTVQADESCLLISSN